MAYKKRLENRKYFIFDDDSRTEKEEYLKELGAAVRNYAKTGVKSSQLEELVKLEEKFQNRYKERFAIDEIICAIKEESMKKVEAYNQQKVEAVQEECREKLPEPKEDREMLFQSVLSSVWEALESRIDNVLMDAVYLSHVNMLYELYEQEEALRKEERQFKELSGRFQNLADISRKISVQRRMNLEELESQAAISKKEIMRVLNVCEGFFNVRPKKNTYLISLSSKGRRYNDFISNHSNIYSDEALNQNVYKNCNNIIVGLKKSYHFKTYYKPQLSGLRPENERAIMHQYRRAVEDIVPYAARRGPTVIDEKFDVMEEEHSYNIAASFQLIEGEGRYGKCRLRL